MSRKSGTQKLLVTFFLLISNSLFAQQFFQKADSLFYSGDYKACEETFNKLPEMAPNHKKFDNAIQRRTECLIRLGRIQEASSLADSLVNCSKKTNNTAGYVRGLALQGYILMNKGLSDDAEEKLQEAETTLPKNNDPSYNELRGDVYNYLGLLYWSTGNTEKAGEYLTTATNLFEKYGNKNQRAGVYNNQGLVYGATEPEKALEYYKLSEKLYSANYSENHPSVALACNNIGFAYLGQNNYTEAERYFERSQHILLNIYGEQHPNIAFVNSALGQTYAAQGKNHRAIKNYENAISIYQKVYGNKHPEIASTKNLLAEQYLKQKQFNPALNTIQQALIANSNGFEPTDITQNPALTQSTSPQVMLYSLFLKAQIFEQRHYEKTLKIDDLRQSLKVLVACDSLLAVMRQTRSNKKDKIELGKIAAQVYETAVAVCIELARITLNKKTYKEKAFYFAEKNKAAVLNEAIADARAKQFSGLPDSLLAKENLLKANITALEEQLAKSDKNNINTRKELLAANSTYESFIEKLEQQFPSYYNLKYNQNIVSVSSLQKSLPANSAMVTYFISESRNTLVVFYISQKKFTFENISLKGNISRTITGFRNCLRYRLDKEYQKLAYELYKQLKPVNSVSKKHHLVIIPDGPLSALPFETLLTKSPKNNDTTNWAELPYLLRQTAISYHVSANLYVQGIQSADTQKMAKTMLAIAPVNFEKEKLSQLEGTLAEVDSLSLLMKESGGTVTSLKYLDASETTLKSEVSKGYSYLHFATHGTVNEVNPDLSCVYLSEKETGKEDGVLYAGEIYNLKLKSQLVSLSACQTGLGKISKGEGLIGLSRAFLYAGASNLLVSLWSVSDASTALLMERMYANILKGKTLAESLQQAKVNLLNGSIYAEPYYWAPFILIGE